MYVYVHVYVHVYMHVYMHVHVCMRMPMCTCVRTYGVIIAAVAVRVTYPLHIRDFIFALVLFFIT